ncbi:MAG TPA: XRE family transcriptional regulator [Hyphomicrobiaceae bacterium]|nr:XRE family transcriptional regulator [Hyphomicrobiaceae bacterium]
MPKSVKAIINPKLLAWARRSANVSLSDAAKKAGVRVETLESWEKGKDAPSVAKLRALADKYKRPLSVFYLPEPPTDFQPISDYRRLPGEVAGVLSPRLTYEIRAAQERRELALSLFEDLGEAPPTFPLRQRLADDPEVIGAALRDLLGITAAVQGTWRDPRVAYNAWRELVEGAGVLVFQTPSVARIPVKEMRGLAIAHDVLPIVLVNAKDAPAARSFSLMHEFAHIVLRDSAISDYSQSNADQPRAPEAQRVEVFCNQVAAATLMPRADFLAQPLLQGEHPLQWTDEELAALAEAFGVSPEAALRRLLTFGRTDQAFYTAKRREILAAQKQFEERERKSKGGPPPHRAALGHLGPGFARLVLQTYYQRRITLNDAANYLGLRLPHISKLEALAYGRAA